MQRQEDGVVWSTVGLRLGNRGMDLRRPSEPGVFAELLNARFLDEATTERRPGHLGRLVQDRGDFTLDKTVLPEWVLGHGTLIAPPDGVENYHHPVAGRGGGVFRLDDTDVVWTGDRLLVATPGGPFLGASALWNRDNDTAETRHGVPAYLPVQTDTPPPETTAISYTGVCLTATQRVVIGVVDERARAWVVDRASGVTTSVEYLDEDIGACTNTRVVSSGGVPTAFWITTGTLFTSRFHGGDWTTPEELDTSVVAYDVDGTTGGCQVVWRVGAALFVGSMAGGVVMDTPYVFGSTVTLGAFTATGEVAIAVSPAGDVAITWHTGGPGAIDIYAAVHHSDLYTCSNPVKVADTTGTQAGLTCCYRGLLDDKGHYPLLVFAADSTAENARAWEMVANSYTGAHGLVELGTGTRANSALTSRAFRVGDEVFCWFRALNSETNYLVAGTNFQVCGIADREEALDDYLADVEPDPLDDAKCVWIRGYVSGENHPGPIRVGEMNFLPEFSSAPFGLSVYLAGSHVRNWDGVQLGDAGFHDYPIVTAGARSNGAGSLTALGVYQVRVYPVRYNRRGERFVGAAVTFTAFALAGAEDTIVWTIHTVPCTNHDDVVLEVYRTTAGGTTFYYDGSVDNDRDTNTVTYTSLLSDAALDNRTADPHETGVSGDDELEEFGPLGCAVLTTVGDRLWGVGGQVPRGLAQFSKLWEPTEGAGFDALAGTTTVDATGAEIVSVTGFGDSAIVFFQRERLYVLGGSGPNNYGLGSFAPAQLVVADGAIAHAGTAVLPIGVVFWGAGGPRLLTSGFEVMNISDPIQPLSSTLTPSGVRVDLSGREVVWYTSTGAALLWNFATNQARWSRWTGLPVAGCSAEHLVTTDGRLLTPADVATDDGRRFSFTFASGDIRPEAMLAGYTLARRVGVVGEYLGSHTPRFRVYYDGCPLWHESFTWEPTENSWLAPGDDFEDLTPAEIDALGPTDHTGVYSVHKRLARQTCAHFRVEMTDRGDVGFVPWELTLELGQRSGPARTKPATIKDY